MASCRREGCFVNAHNVADSPAFMATIGQPSLPAYVRDACVLLVRFQFHIQGTLAIEQLDLSGHVRIAQRGPPVPARQFRA